MGHVCFILLRKEFDTLDHSLLLKKKQRYDYSGPIFETLSD